MRPAVEVLGGGEYQIARATELAARVLDIPPRLAATDEAFVSPLGHARAQAFVRLIPRNRRFGAGVGSGDARVALF